MDGGEADLRLRGRLRLLPPPSRFHFRSLRDSLSHRPSVAPPWRRHTSTEPWRSVVNSEFSQRDADGKTATHTHLGLVSFSFLNSLPPSLHPSSNLCHKRSGWLPDLQQESCTENLLMVPPAAPAGVRPLVGGGLSSVLAITVRNSTELVPRQPSGPDLLGHVRTRWRTPLVQQDHKVCSAGR